MEKVLIVEDNSDLRENMRWALAPHFSILEVGTIPECIDVFSHQKPPVVCLDMGLDNIPDGGLQIIDKLLLIDRYCKIIVITANTGHLLGPEAVKRGAFDFFNKPFDIEQIRQTIDRAIKIRSLELATAQPLLQHDIKQSLAAISIVGESPVMNKVLAIIQKLSQTDVNVLITGESGTGKELCARALHYLSKRKSFNFVPINCGAIPENLIESELFGYVKGAFTGANSDKEGLIQSAGNGTLLLDEIGEMPKNLQVKLLRFLEDSMVQRIGDTSFKKFDVRIIAATNRKNLQDAHSSLREDLYYRLSEFQIDLPPLRERGEDVLLIAKALLEKNRIKYNRNRLRCSSRAEQALLGYSWPGNIRELENKLIRASITCINDCIEPEDLQISVKKQFTSYNYHDVKEAFDKEFIEALLIKCENNISEASKISGISRPTLYAMIKKAGG